MWDPPREGGLDHHDRTVRHAQEEENVCLKKKNEAGAMRCHHRPRRRTATAVTMLDRGHRGRHDHHDHHGHGRHDPHDLPEKTLEKTPEKQEGMAPPHGVTEINSKRCPTCLQWNPRHSDAAMQRKKEVLLKLNKNKKNIVKERNKEWTTNKNVKRCKNCLKWKKKPPKHSNGKGIVKGPKKWRNGVEKERKNEYKKKK
jgi:hypothetical protein